MINRNDILDALTKSTAYDSQHTPAPSKILIDAWLEHFETYAAGVERDELLAAVAEYHREPRDRMLQPADLSTLCRALRRDSLDRMDPDERLLAVGASASSELPDYPDDWTSEQRLSAYWHTIDTGTRPATTKNWHTVLKAAQARKGRPS